jgi:dTDP-4-dehydrorhamnose reductase
VGRSARRASLEHLISDPVRERYPRVLITGAGGQLGSALAEAFPWADARTRAELDVVRTIPDGYDLVLHAAAWTNVDGAESNEAEAEAANVLGTRNMAAAGTPVVYFSTDYVFDGAKREPYVESDEPRPLSIYGRTKLAGEREIRDGWIVRSSWLFGATGHNFVRTMLRLGAERDEVSVVDDQRGSPTFVAHLAVATLGILGLPQGVYHVVPDGDCTWADFAEAIFEATGSETRVRRITTAEYGAAAPRPAYSVLRSEKGAPTLPYWREGLRDCLQRLDAVEGS